jgi:hypothetical protein
MPLDHLIDVLRTRRSGKGTRVSGFITNMSLSASFLLSRGPYKFQFDPPFVSILFDNHIERLAERGTFLSKRLPFHEHPNHVVYGYRCLHRVLSLVMLHIKSEAFLHTIDISTDHVGRVAVEGSMRRLVIYKNIL